MNDNSLPTIEPYTVEEYQDPTSQFQDSPYSQYDSSPITKKRFPTFLIIMAVAIIGLVIFGFLLLGSLGETGNNSNTNQDINNEVALLQWRGVFLDSEIVQPLIDDYKLVKPNVTITYSNEWPIATNFEDAARSYQLQLNQDLQDVIDAPDIFMVHNSWAPDYQSIAAPSNVYSQSTFEQIFYPAASTDFVTNGLIYGAPLWMDTFAIVYNKDMLSAIGKSEPDDNWNDFIETAELLTSINGNKIEQAGFAAGSVNNTDFFYELMLTLILQNGTLYNSETKQPNFSADPNSVEAINFFGVFTNANKTWDETFNNDSAAFLEERVAMIYVPSWRLRELLILNEQNNLNIDIGVSRVPQVPGQSQEIINWSDYWGLMANNERGNSAVAWEFISWLNEPDQQEKLHENIKNSYGYFGNLYTRVDMNNYLLDDEYLKVYNESLPFADSWYVVKGRDVRNLFKEEFINLSVSSSKLSNLENDIKQLMALKGILSTFENE